MAEVTRSVRLEVEVDTNKRTRCETWDWDDFDGLAEDLAERLFQWNTPSDPYFVINGRLGETDAQDDPYVPIVRAVLDALVFGDTP